jgi:hypothetical protein
MIYPLILVALGLLGACALPFWVYDIHRRFAEPDSFGLGLAVAGMAACVVVLEYTLRLVGELWEKEVRRWPAGAPVPRPDPVALLRWAVLVYCQLAALMMFLTTMDGGLRWAAARWVYPTYAAPALALAAARWRRWTEPERLYLRWGWAPALAFGVPFALPRLLAAGLITNPWD